MTRAATQLATKKRKAVRRNRAGKGEPEKHAFYRAALRRLNLSGIPYLIGGAFALESVTGIFHHTKDLDVFVRRADLERTLALLRDELDCRTHLTYPHWLAKAFWREHFIDVIFSTGNGLAEVDDTWLERGLPAEALEVPVRLCPLEETIWTKAFVMERERYDGADIAHLIL